PPLLRGTAGRVALDYEELGLRRVALLAVGELAGEAVVGERALAPREIARLARSRARARGVLDLRDQRAGDGGILFEIIAELLVDDVLHEPAHVGRAELGLGLAFELGLRELHRDHRSEALARVVARKRLAVLALAVLHLRRDVAVERTRERGTEADQVAAALDGVDVVRERVDRLVVALVVLNRDLDPDRHVLAAALERALARDQDRWPVQRRARAVQVIDERDDAALVAELVALPAALVADVDPQPGVQERQLAQALRQHVELVLRAREDLCVGQERDARAGL